MTHPHNSPASPSLEVSQGKGRDFTAQTLWEAERGTEGELSFRSGVWPSSPEFSEEEQLTHGQQWTPICHHALTSSDFCLLCPWTASGPLSQAGT